MTAALFMTWGVAAIIMSYEAYADNRWGSTALLLCGQALFMVAVHCIQKKKR